MKIIYQPTTEELLEMGFEKRPGGNHYTLKTGRIQHRIIQYYAPGLHEHPGFFFECDYIYPSSKQALLDFISNFSPNE